MFKRITSKTFLQKKTNNEKLALLTAYDYSTAKYLDESGVDAILVGDSLGMVALGYETTHQVTIQEMEIFTSAVVRGSKSALVIADMPFLSTSVSIEKGIENAGKLIRAGAGAVKIEGGDDFTVELVKRLVGAGIAVVAHLGFTPQFLHVFGGYNVQGKTFEQTEYILNQAKKLQAAGAFALVLEMVPEESARFITENLKIPTIGIGAGRFCDGQILVIDDVLGKFSNFAPKFAKKYADIKTLISEATATYVKEVKTQLFPSIEHVFNLKEEEKEKFNDKINTQN